MKNEQEAAGQRMKKASLQHTACAEMLMQSISRLTGGISTAPGFYLKQVKLKQNTLNNCFQECRLQAMMTLISDGK